MKVKWGVIGAAGIADRRTIPGIMSAENAELIAVMEINMDLAEKIRKKYDAKKAYNNIDDILSNEEVQAVYIASPVGFHKEQAIKAAKAKKHILIEKPIALTSEEGLEVLECCKKNGVLIAAGFMMRFNAYNQKIKGILQSNGIGDLVNCSAQLSCWFPDMEDNWRQIKSKGGGGALIDLGVHCLDLIMYMTGQKIKRVVALNSTQTFNYEVEDSSKVVFELSNGAFGHVDSYFNIPDDASDWRMEFYGTRGRILASDTIGQEGKGKVEVIKTNEAGEYNAQQNNQKLESTVLKAEFIDMYEEEIRVFSESILTGKELEAPASAALQVQKIIEAAYKSSETGRFIEII